MESTNICKNCSSNIDAGCKYCPNCGTYTNNETTYEKEDENCTEYNNNFKKKVLNFKKTFNKEKALPIIKI